MDVRIRAVPPMRVVYTAYEGPLDKVGPIFDRIQEWMRGHDQPDHPVIGVFVETRQPLDEEGNPKGAPDGLAEAWVELSTDPDEAVRAAGDDPDVGVKEVPGVTVASTLFEGHPLDLIVLQDQLRRFLRQNGYRIAEATRFVYLDADWSRINLWKTEVQVPLLEEPTSR